MTTKVRQGQTTLSVDEAKYNGLRRLDGTPWVVPVERGAIVLTSSQDVGRFVGVSPVGTVWVYWQEETPSLGYYEMCDDFDYRYMSQP